MNGRILQLLVAATVAIPVACGVFSTEPEPMTVVFSGIVRSADDGRPIEGVTVKYGVGDPGVLLAWVSEDITDSHGRYGFREERICEQPYGAVIEAKHLDYYASTVSFEALCTVEPQVVELELRPMGP